MQYWLWRNRWIVVAVLSFWLTVGSVPALSQTPISPVVPSTVPLPVSSPTPSTSIQDQVERGRTLYASGQLTEAIALWQQSLQAYRVQQDDLHQALVLSYLALAYQHLGAWSDATDTITTAFQYLATPSTHTSTERSPILAQALTARGYLEFSQGRPEQALETWQQATALYRQLEDATGITGSLINQAQAMDMMGLHRRTCQTLLAAIDLDQTCDAQQVQDMDSILQAFDAQTNAQIRWLGLHSFGNVLRSVGALSQSAQVLEQSLNIAQQLESLPILGTTWLSLGNTRRELYNQAVELFDRTQLEGDRQTAETYASQALENYQTAAQTVLTLPSALTIQVQAQVQRLGLLSDWQRWAAQSAIDTATVLPAQTLSSQTLSSQTLPSQIQAQIRTLLEIPVTTLPTSRAAIYAQLELARQLGQRAIWLEPNRLWMEAAFEWGQHALQQATELHDVNAQSYAQGTLGHLYELLAQVQQQPDDWKRAQTVTESALLSSQSIQAWEIVYQWQWQLGRIHRIQGHKSVAIAYYQAAVDTLKSVRRDLSTTSTDVQFSFRDNIEPVYRELVQLILEDAETTSAPSQDILRQVTQQMSALRVSELENFLRCNLVQTVAIAEESVDPTAAILYPIILEKQLAVILKLPQINQLYLHTVPLSKTTVDQTTEQLRSELEKPYPSSGGLALSQEIYTWLIQPIESVLQSNHIKTLVFVPDGSLRNIPMSALHDGQRYLIENYAVAISPSLELLQPQPLSQTRLRVLSFGLSQLQRNFPPHQGFAPLTHVGTELTDIQSQIPSRVFLNQEFTSSALQRFVSSIPFPVVHLATHGQFSSNLQETFVLAWDRRITIHELSSILQNRAQSNATPIQLLVLSACKTADGDSRSTLGLAGVAIQSGARSTIASLWSIDDKATAEFMSHFYQALSNSPVPITKAEALRQAQVMLSQTDGYQAPFYWAPYVLVGNWL